MVIIFISSMLSKPINIRWIRTGSQLYCKIMHSIGLQTNFHEDSNNNHKIKTSFVSPEGPKTMLKAHNL